MCKITLQRDLLRFSRIISLLEKAQKEFKENLGAFLQRLSF
jgi:hypothetical protein